MRRLIAAHLDSATCVSGVFAKVVFHRNSFMRNDCAPVTRPGLNRDAQRAHAFTADTIGASTAHASHDGQRAVQTLLLASLLKHFGEIVVPVATTG